MTRLHLGCGAILFPGWLNVDAEPRPGVTVRDLARPFPEADGSVDLIFHEHFLEHLTREDGVAFLRECRRVLRPGGWMRCSTPCLGIVADDYVAGKLDRIDRSVWAPASPARMLNEAMRLWGHQHLYDLYDLVKACREAGFGVVQYRHYGRSGVAGMATEQRPDCGEAIIVEATP